VLFVDGADQHRRGGRNLNRCAVHHPCKDTLAGSGYRKPLREADIEGTRPIGLQNEVIKSAATRLAASLSGNSIADAKYVRFWRQGRFMRAR
jgi:hypothetical protein